MLYCLENASNDSQCLALVQQAYPVTAAADVTDKMDEHFVIIQRPALLTLRPTMKPVLKARIRPSV